MSRIKSTGKTAGGTPKQARGSRFVAGMIAGLLVLGAPAAALADTLADALAGAYNNSGLLEQNRALLRAADEDVGVALSALRPIIGWSADVTYSDSDARSSLTGIRSTDDTSGSLGLSADILLFDGGRSRMGVDIAKESVLATRQALIGVEQNILLQAVQAFMDVRSNTEIVALRRNNVRVITQELRAAQDRFEVGEVTRTDVALAEARLAGANALLAQAEGDLAEARAFYRFAVGRDANALAVPPALPARPASLAAAQAAAMRSHPDILRAQHEVTVSDLRVLIAKSAAIPQVRLQSRYGLTESLDSSDYNRGGSVGIGVTGPIYQGGRNSALERQAINRGTAARSALFETTQRIAQNVSTAFARVDVARAAIEASDRQIRAARTAFEGVREEATLGARTTLDVLNAEQELLDAQANRITAASNQYVASYALLASMGQLTAQNLRLQVQIYDPSSYYNQVQSAPSSISRQGRQLDQVLKSLGRE
ncbi:TolC family outer membrane protein [Seohaeicola sp. SP36]|uniref:TolC family outer membrane protein n=1 Tax=unclassified Seohaeicola TaxID=2641111 RepID=UPI00237A9F97|nr:MULTISPECIES: TolC family outer membrane protein [unclassified Seohaeicola]MDD9708209.1 TolC family outer membrane protein [Seohaeicola sp. 4SK31]MDD9736393.1 TolC family outer membrane protein [Seohaeicola sp. SP36]